MAAGGDSGDGSAVGGPGSGDAGEDGAGDSLELRRNPRFRTRCTAAAPASVGGMAEGGASAGDPDADSAVLVGSEGWASTTEGPNREQRKTKDNRGSMEWGPVRELNSDFCLRTIKFDKCSIKQCS